MKLGKFTKQPLEREVYAIEYDADMPNNDAVQGVVLNVFPVDGLTLSAIITTLTRVQLWASGGINGVTYKITVTATTISGRVLQDEVLLKIKEI